ncbi:MAG: class I SAM-dependent methyltransferase [Desulfobacula sp.]|jgi:2-polyprenyl-3-methyl-5-hydroxy-6-metoxy-1,4-benzoquinol methylase|nr:class I SAM-dependent methyltransferase [Desulfobacula sp.]MBT4289044.1 class I SAM-dependent methyltransferase [Deltaproteobacteria bacterium]
MNFETASFRDPSGQIFLRDDKIFRSIYSDGVEDFEAARQNSIYEESIQNGYLIEHTEASLTSAPEGSIYCIEHPLIKMITYPWEWSFSMLKDAALLHLDMMDFLIPKGFWLRDANAFNVQCHNGKLLLIDTLSIGKRTENSPWVAYNQFCSHFLAPLAVAAYSDIRTLGLWRANINGYPLDLAARLLPTLKKYSPGLLMHLTMHAHFQKKSQKRQNLKTKTTTRPRKFNDLALSGLINSLRKTISKIKINLKSEIWSEYDSIRTYQSDDVIIKTDFVRKIISRLLPETVWDLGGNTGEFSMTAAQGGAFVMSIDGDPACTEFIYQKRRSQKNGERILPITMDLANPSPSLGWESEERKSLTARGPADLVLSLALIHHLVFSSNIPLNRIAKWFAAIGKYCIVEYMPLDDPMVKTLTENRTEHHPYSLEAFKSAFGIFFTELESMQLNNNRILFFFKRKN